MLPADQSLKPDDPPIRKHDNGLIVQHKLVERGERLHLFVADRPTRCHVEYRIAEFLNGSGLTHPSRAARPDRSVERTRPLSWSELNARRGGQRCTDDDDLWVVSEQAHDTLKNHLVVVDHDDPDDRLLTHCYRAPCVD